MLTPEKLGTPQTEHAQQVAVFCWISNEGQHLEPLLRWAHAVPNGGDRNVAVAGRLKAEGVKSGVWDINVPIPRGKHHGLWIEMKKPGREKESKGGLSDTQEAFGLAMHSAGFKTAVCYTWQQAVKVIREYCGI